MCTVHYIKENIANIAPQDVLVPAVNVTVFKLSKVYKTTSHNILYKRTFKT
jgi:hypothetical protein